MKKSTPDNIDEIFRNKFSEFEVDPFPESKEKIFTDFYSDELKNKEVKNKYAIVFNYKYAVAATVVALIIFTGIYLVLNFENKRNIVADNSFIKKEKINNGLSGRSPGNKHLIKTETPVDEKIKMEKDQVIPDAALTPGRVEMVRHKSDVEKQVLYLPDSSKVFLNKYSELSYPKDFLKNERIVNISGEVYFDVKKMNNRTFVVNTALSKIEVLGTSFCVKSFKDGTEQVFVESGKVLFCEKLNPDKNKILLSPGMKAILNAGKPIVSVDGNNLNDISWKTNKLIFHKVPLKEVIEDIEDAFEIKIKASDLKIYDCHFTGRFDLTSSLDEVLSTIAVSLNGSYEIKNRVCTLYSKGCN